MSLAVAGVTASERRGEGWSGEYVPLPQAIITQAAACEINNHSTVLSGTSGNTTIDHGKSSRLSRDGDVSLGAEWPS